MAGKKHNKRNQAQKKAPQTSDSQAQASSGRPVAPLAPVKAPAHSAKPPTQSKVPEPRPETKLPHPQHVESTEDDGWQEVKTKKSKSKPDDRRRPETWNRNERNERFPQLKQNSWQYGSMQSNLKKGQDRFKENPGRGQNWKSSDQGRQMPSSAIGQQPERQRKELAKSKPTPDIKPCTSTFQEPKVETPVLSAKVESDLLKLQPERQRKEWVKSEPTPDAKPCISFQEPNVETPALSTKVESDLLKSTPTSPITADEVETKDSCTENEVSTQKTSEEVIPKSDRANEEVLPPSCRSDEFLSEDQVNIVEEKEPCSEIRPDIIIQYSRKDLYALRLNPKTWTSEVDLPYFIFRKPSQVDIDSYIEKMKEFEEYDVVLHTNENSWTPTALKSTNDAAPIDVKESTTKKFISILNKITPDKFETLSKQLIELNPQNVLSNDELADIFHIRALDEKFYIKYYVQLMSYLSKELKNGPQNKTFVQYLLSNCQKEYIKEYTEADFEICKIKGIEDEELYAKERKISNLKILGELCLINYKQYSFIVKECLKSLLKKSNEVDAELAISLLEIIGPVMKSQDSEVFKKAGDQLSAIRKTTNISTRIRFKISDYLDLVTSNFRGRENDAIKKVFKPQVIGKPAPVAPPEQNQSLGYHQGRGGGYSGGQWPQIQSRSHMQGNRYQGNNFNRGQNNHRFNNQTSRVQQQGPTWRNDNTMKLSAPRMPFAHIPTKKEPKQEFVKNKFSILEEQIESTEQIERESVEEESPTQEEEIPFQEEEKPNEQELENATGASDSLYSEDVIRRKINYIIQEGSLIEKIEEMRELRLSSESWADLVQFSLEAAIETNSGTRKETGKLLKNLAEITRDELCSGLDRITDMAEDFLMDVPHFWTYLAEIFEDFDIGSELTSQLRSKTSSNEDLAKNLRAKLQV